MELILTHINADFDGLASALAASKLYPHAKIFLPGSQEHCVRDFLKQYPDVFVKVISAKSLKNIRFERIILVDVSHEDRLGSFQSLLQQGQPHIICYDHHASSEGNLMMHERHYQDVGANTTLLIQLLQQKKIQLTRMEATVLALGIYEETGNFTYTSTRSADFRAAAYVLEQQADLGIVSEFMQRPFDKSQQRLFELMIQSRVTHGIHGVPVSFVHCEWDQFVEDLAVVVNRIKELENLPVLFAFCRMHKRTYIIARSSLGNIDVGRLLGAFQGGGHATAASAALGDMDLGHLRRKVLAILKKEICPLTQVKDIMRFPVTTLQASDRVTQAREVVLRSGYLGLPVMEKKRLVGKITFHDLDKAYQHRLATAIVSDYMSSHPDTLGPEETLAGVREKMIAKRTQYMPVVARGRLVGIVTKNDLLRYSHESDFHLPAKSYFSMWDEEELTPSHVRQLLQTRLPERIVTVLHTAGEVADRMGLKAYVVGGFVRDLIIDKENLDVDIMVEGDGIAYAKELAKKMNAHIKVHPRFKTAKLRCHDHFGIDVASARTEYYEKPAALPQVVSASLQYDLFRRDFTINAMAICINTETFGTLIDYFNGLHDLHEGTIRVLYALSFVDDPTRVFRAIRFAQRYGFILAQDTQRYMEQALTSNLLGKLSHPRIFDELMLILDEDQPLKALQQFEALRLWQWIHPALKSMKEALKQAQTIWESLAFAILFFEEKIDQKAVYLMTLFSSLSVAQMMTVSQQCQFPKKIKEMIMQQKREGDRTMARLLRKQNPKPIEVVIGLRGLTLETLLFALNQNRKNSLGQWLRKYLTVWRYVKCEITGRDLKKRGYVPGPLYDRILKSLLAAKLEKQVMTRRDEIRFLQKKYPLAKTSNSKKELSG